ncbi:hypothetical protein ABEB36_015629 [Hypothenemus hampei]|uniref:Regulatory protein zeste n=1 Tax=Hypothenemus hampei TaxID=57062 RepID=A0ABD1DZ96_HYPHA
MQKTGNSTWQEKKLAWEAIENKFNSQNNKSIRRYGDQLKEKYNNLKKKTKKKYSDNKMNILKTGGGSYISTEFSNAEKTLYQIIWPQVDGLQNNYDDDSVPQIESDNNTKNVTEIDCIETGSSNMGLNHERTEIEIDFIDQNEDNEIVDKSWKSYSSKSLKAPVSQKLTLKQKNKKIITNKAKMEKKYVPWSNELIEAKLKFVNDQHEKFLEEHKLKMQILKMKLKIKEKKCQNLGINIETL